MLSSRFYLFGWIKHISLPEWIDSCTWNAFTNHQPSRVLGDFLMRHERRNTSSVRVFHPLCQISSNFFWLLLFRGYTHITLYVGKFCLHVNNSTVLLANTIRLPPLSIRSTKGTNNRKLVFLNNLAISFLIPAKSLKFSSSCSLQNASLVSPYSGFNGRKSYKCLKAIRLRRWKILPCSLESRFFLFFYWDS